MRELEMHNGEVCDARPECPECDRVLVRSGPGDWNCANCNEWYTDEEVDSAD